MLLTIVFFTHSLSTYQNYKVIYLNIWYKKLLRGICWAFVSLLLDGSFWSIDFIWKTFDILATGSLRATLFLEECLMDQNINVILEKEEKLLYN